MQITPMQTPGATLAPSNPLVQALAALTQPNSPAAPRFVAREVQPVTDSTAINAAITAAEQAIAADRLPPRGSFINLTV